MRFVVSSIGAAVFSSALLTGVRSSAQPPTLPKLPEHKDYKHSWIEVDGVNAHYIEAGQGEKVVLIHGNLSWSSSEGDYGVVMAPLGKHFHVIAPDTVGYGYTTPRGPQHYSGEAQARFLIRFLEVLGVGPIFLVGNSHGGFLTQYIALERPELVRRLVIANSGSGTSSLASRPNGKSFTYAPGERQYQSQTKEQIRKMLERYYEHKDLVTEERVELVYDLYQKNYEFAAQRGEAVESSVEVYDRNQFYKGKHISEWAGELKMPVLLMWSQPGSRMEWGLTHYFKIPGAEMHLLPWSGHHLFSDQSERWSQVVTDWLKNEPARPPNR